MDRASEGILSIRQISGERCTRSQLLIRSLFRLLEVNPILFGDLPAGIAIFCPNEDNGSAIWPRGRWCGARS